MSFDPNDRPDFSPSVDPAASAKGKVTVPGVLLIVCAVFNFLLVVVYGFATVNIATQDAEKFHAQQVEVIKKAQEAVGNNKDAADNPFLKAMQSGFTQSLEQLENTPPDQFKMQNLLQNGGLTAYMVLVTLLQFFGGLRMMAMRSYALALIASMFSILPCLSLSGCCGIGQLAGIWGLVVLFNSDVKASFK